jgi:transcriptional regulator with XRE-family HTH domain
MIGTNNKDQARLRLVKSEDLDLCSSYSRTAGEPLGSSVLPCSMSLTADGERPTLSPISASVMPLWERRSEMNVAKGYEVIRPSLRQAVDSRQRLPVTVFRNNHGMPRPTDMPKDLDSIGKRVRWWREHKKYSRAKLAKLVGYKSVSGLSDLELGESNGSEKLHLIAAHLGLNPHYVQTGEGEPEASFPQEPPQVGDDWPFPAVPQSRLKRLNKIERSYAETKLLEALAEIESERRNRTG